MLGLLAAMGTGLLSGVVPACRAIRINPVEALYAD
jgi:ABC-type antimicrobial peptide transport system permease subunit